MECKHWNETWVAYLYDECPADERDAIREHLSGCDSCRERMDSLDETRRTVQSAAPEIAAPPRVIVLPAAPRRVAGWGSFAAGFAAAAAVFAIGLFIGMQYFSTQQTILQAGGEFASDDPVAAQSIEADPRFRQIREDYRTLDDRLGQVERWLPEAAGDTPPTLATLDRVQTAVGSLSEQFDLRRTQDFQFIVETILAADQESRRRDARTWQTLGVVHAENNPNVRQH